MKTKLCILIGLIFCTKVSFSNECELMNIIIDDINSSVMSYQSSTLYRIDLYDSIRKTIIEVNDIKFLIKNFINLIKIDTILGEYCNCNYGNGLINEVLFRIYIIDISINLDWYSDIRERGYDTLTYVVLSVDINKDYYKMFGFYNSDIQLLHKDIITCVANYMVKRDILSYKEARYYKQSVIKKRDTIHWKVNKPCEYFKCFYRYNHEKSLCTNIQKRELLMIERRFTITRRYPNCIGLKIY